MKGWKLYKNSELITAGILEIGDGYRAKNTELGNIGLPFARAGNINNGFHFEDADLLIPKSVEKAKGKISCLNDCVITTKGTFGRVAYVNKNVSKFVYSPQLCFWRSRKYKILSPRFLFYWLQGPDFLNQAYQIKSSTDMADYASLTDQRRMTMFLPNSDIQRKIATVLSAYDDLIENNNRRIAILEKMAEELYREWFVRLRFPGHEKTKIIKGIPEGWEEKKVGDLGRVVTGKTPPTEDYSLFSGDWPFIKTPDMHKNMFLTKTMESLSEKGCKAFSAHVVPAKSICVSCIGTGGVTSISSMPSITNQQINTVILEKDHFLQWAYFVLKGMRELIDLFGYTGSTMTNLSKGKFEKLKILFPKDKIISEFNSKTAKIFDSILNLMNTNNILSVARDKLLSRLMSGKIDLENLDIQFPASMQEDT